MWSCHIYFRKFALFILERFALFILESFLLGVAFCNLERFFSFFFFLFFWIIKNLFPKGQCPTNNQEEYKYKKPRLPDKPKNEQHLPYKIGEGASARYKNPTNAKRQTNHINQAHRHGIRRQTTTHTPTYRPTCKLTQAHIPGKGETNHTPPTARA